ncbi:LIRP-like [Lycorma delicatula]|uniref:LIRP-like n=1 Tax=Lycorma delicatula TaxID=130591 RepID=UPI003F5147A5
MFVKRLVLLIVCMVYLDFVQAQTDLFQMFDKRENGKYCGKNLVAALQLICNGVYNSMFKKSSYSDEINNEDWIMNTDIENVQYPFKSRASATALMPGTFHGRTRGIYDECCRKSCSVREMAGYCGR